MATKKIDIINDAYSQLRISGLTAQPSGDDVGIALSRLENMMHELEPRLGVGFNFEDIPDPNTSTGVEPNYNHMMATNLAVRLVPDFNKDIPPALMMQASSSFSSASAASLIDNLQSVDYPRRMPIGGGNRLSGQFRRYQAVNTEAPNTSATQQLLVAEIDDYSESFAAYLGQETIDTYTITVTDGLNLQGSVNSDPVIDYRVKAASAGAQSVTITITSDSGRIESRVINFQVNAT